MFIVLEVTKNNQAAVHKNLEGGFNTDYDICEYPFRLNWKTYFMTAIAESSFGTVPALVSWYKDEASYNINPNFYPPFGVIRIPGVVFLDSKKNAFTNPTSPISPAWMPPMTVIIQSNSLRTEVPFDDYWLIDTNGRLRHCTVNLIDPSGVYQVVEQKWLP